ncbi:unnamed protein product [Brachionus calyciflorus]|uniref:Uncharacterized protein n=1 Tax=Brachionus calyciflorus TaxID=104777 RepID=A0A814RJV2_9BILA|nr:unnamed protein product [Brachionus calyciflorus]
MASKKVNPDGSIARGRGGLTKKKQVQPAFYPADKQTKQNPKNESEQADQFRDAREDTPSISISNSFEGVSELAERFKIQLDNLNQSNRTTSRPLSKINTYSSSTFQLINLKFMTYMLNQFSISTNARYSSKKRYNTMLGNISWDQWNGEEFKVNQLRRQQPSATNASKIDPYIRK